MKNLGDIMKQAQALQQKVADAKAKLAETEVEGTAGGGMVKVTLKNVGDLVRLDIDESLLKPGEGEIVADLIIAAHADARRKLEAAQAELMRDATGMLAGIPGLPSF
ncbi:MAG TPA: YbaB/EbfC family nucleoid-associated protein [Caulobacteraceae bacterium]|nr:YbaB/EbfC family nucleoid-associated protein [Caulobacteraceae bacterium]